MTAGCGWESCEPLMGTGTVKAVTASRPERSFGWRIWRPKVTAGCGWESCEPLMGTGTVKAVTASRPERSFDWRIWRPRVTAGCGWESCEPSMGTGTAKVEKGLTPAKSFGWRVWRPNGKVGCCWESFARGCCRLERNFWAQSAETAAPEGPKAPKGKIRTPIQPRAELNFWRVFHA